MEPSQIGPLLLQFHHELLPTLPPEQAALHSQITKIEMIQKEQCIFELKTHEKTVVFRPYVARLFAPSQPLNFDEEKLRLLAQQIVSINQAFPLSSPIRELPTALFIAWWDLNDPFILQTMQRYGVVSLFQHPQENNAIALLTQISDASEDFWNDLMDEYRRLLHVLAQFCTWYAQERTLESHCIPFDLYTMLQNEMRNHMRLQVILQDTKYSSKAPLIQSFLEQGLRRFSGSGTRTGCALA